VLSAYLGTITSTFPELSISPTAIVPTVPFLLLNNNYLAYDQSLDSFVLGVNKSTKPPSSADTII